MKQNHFRILLSCLLLLCLLWAMPGQARAAGGAYIEGEKLALDSPRSAGSRRRCVLHLPGCRR